MMKITITPDRDDPARKTNTRVAKKLLDQLDASMFDMEREHWSHMKGALPPGIYHRNRKYGFDEIRIREYLIQHLAKQVDELGKQVHRDSIYRLKVQEAS